MSAAVSVVSAGAGGVLTWLSATEAEERRREVRSSVCVFIEVGGVCSIVRYFSVISVKTILI